MQSVPQENVTDNREIDYQLTSCNDFDSTHVCIKQTKLQGTCKAYHTLQAYAIQCKTENQNVPKTTKSRKAISNATASMGEASSCQSQSHDQVQVPDHIHERSSSNPTILPIKLTTRTITDTDWCTEY